MSFLHHQTLAVGYRDVNGEKTFITSPARSLKAENKAVVESQRDAELPQHHGQERNSM